MATVSNSKSFARSRAVGSAHLALIGCNHRTAPVELRERVAFTSEQALEAAGELRKRGILEEAVVLSTCNRSELYGVPAGSGAAVTDAMEDFLTSYHRIPRADLHGRTYRWFGSDAVRHLFRVAAGLDSMLLGEAEILGQLRTAYGQALDNGSTGPMLNRAFQGALEVGKRVRSETEVGARPMSVALAGVKLAERVFGNLKGHSALIVGAGAVAEQVVEHLRNRGIGSLRVANRSHDHAAELAERMGGEAVAWASLDDVLGAPDIIVTSVSSGAVLTREMLDARIGRARWPPGFCGGSRSAAQRRFRRSRSLQFVPLQHRRPRRNRRAEQARPRSRNPARRGDHRRTRRAKFESLARRPSSRFYCGRPSRAISQTARATFLRERLAEMAPGISPEEQPAPCQPSPKN